MINLKCFICTSLMIALCLSGNLYAQINITHSQGFEGGGASSLGSAGGTIWTYTQTGGSQSSGSNNNPGNPASVPLASQGNNGWQLDNTTNNPQTCTVTFSNIAFAAPTGNERRIVEFRLAGMGKDDNEGIDPGDYVDVELSFNNGATWQHEVHIELSATSSSDVGYSFGINSTFSKTADGISTNVTYLPAWVRLVLPLASTQVRIRITLRNNQNKERWVIDDVRCGTIRIAPVVEDFENASSAPIWNSFDVAINTNVGIPEGNTNVTGAISMGTNPAAGNPANANLFAPVHPNPPTAHGTQQRGFQLDNTSNASAICARAFNHTYIKEGEHNYIEFRVAGMGKTGGQGVDGDDFVELQVSINGQPYSRELRLRGNSQNGWDFGATGIIQANYEGDLSPTLYAAAANAGITASTIRLRLPAYAFQVAARIVMRNNNNQERWVIDNVRLYTDPAPPPAPPVPDVTFTYDGFDYYEDNEDVSDANFTFEKNQKTVASYFPYNDESIHNYVNVQRESSVNSRVSLGWADNWKTSDDSDAYYIGGIVTITPGEQVLVQSGSYPISTDDQSYNLVNSGLFLQTQLSTTASVGRRLQTSTGGPAFIYSIVGAPLPAGTNPVTSGKVQVHPASPIVFTNSASPTADPTTHKTPQNEPTPALRTNTVNTRLGAHGSSIWLGVMMRKGANNTDPIFVSLHRNTNPWDVSTANAIQVGYFGGNPKHWALRIGGTTYYAGSNNTTPPTATNTNTVVQTSEEDTPSGTNYRGDEWDLLVMEIKYDYGANKNLVTGAADDNHRVRLYVIRDFRRNTHPADPDAGLGGTKESGANFSQFINNPTTLNTGWDIEVTGIQGDYTFHSIAFRGSGGYTGPSGLPNVTTNLYFSDAIDEIRFGTTFSAAALYSPTVSLIRGLCEQNGGTPGVNVFPEGTFGIAESLTAEGFLATNVTIASQSFEDSGSSVAVTGNTGVVWNYTPTLTTANFSVGNNNVAGNPPGSPLYSDGIRGIQLLNTTGNPETLTITTNPIALPKPAGVNNVYILLDVAGMGNAAGEGVDNNDDQVVLAISTDNGGTYTDEVTINPSGLNVGWSLGGPIFTDPATGVNNITTINPGRVQINLPSGATNVSLRITMTNNALNERWVVDNIRLEALNAGVVGEQVATAAGRYHPSENPNARNRNPKILANDDCPGSNNFNCPVVFEDGTALIGDPPVAYNAFTGPNYTYVFNQDNRPNDGMYMVANRSGHLFGASSANPSWYPVYDNTNANKNGMLMNINAAYAKSEFYSKTAANICPDTQYEFYVDVFNTLRAVRRTITNPNGDQGAQACNPLVEPGCQQMSFAGTDQTGNSGIGAASHGDNGGNPNNSFLINPEIQFLINGKPLYTPPVSVPNNTNGSNTHKNSEDFDENTPAEWRRTGFTFITKPSVGSVNVSFRNIAPGGSGNDLNIDNITFRPCGPRSRIRQVAAPINFCPNGDVIHLDVGAIGAGFTNPYVRWEYSCDGGNTWSMLPLGTIGLPNPMAINTPYINIDDGYYPGSNTTIGINLYQLSPASNPNPTIPDPNKPLRHGCIVRAVFAGNLANLDNERCRFITTMTIDCPNPLLAEEIRLSAKAQNSGIAVKWSMMNEGNMKEYILERSNDMLNYVPITHFIAKNSGDMYSYLDVVPFEGMNYYRVKGITKNGEFRYSNVVSESWTGKGGVNLYPNPADAGVYVAFSKLFEERQQVKIRIVSIMGASMYENDYYLEGLQKTLYVPTDKLSNGLYVIELQIGDFRITDKLVIKH